MIRRPSDNNTRIGVVRRPSDQYVIRLPANFPLPDSQPSPRSELQRRLKEEPTPLDGRRPQIIPNELAIWSRVNSDLGPLHEPHQLFWWRQHAGKSLAVLLHHAEYPPDVQYRDLKFFAQVVAPHLGISRDVIKGNTSLWPSFMTDDGTPLELSWDWGSKDSAPTIRYSVEPIGMNAGTHLDPANLLTGPLMQKQIIRALPSTRLEWFNHFVDFFNNSHGEEESYFQDSQDHNSSIFYAFDLSPKTDITAKVYFFPKMRARQRRQTNLDVIFDAMYSAPQCNEQNMRAAEVFGDFCSDPRNSSMEYEMLAIDLIDPLESRLKVYFRTRETTFDSVVNAMTLGGRIGNPKIYEGVEELRKLWNAVFGTSEKEADDQPLESSLHRTAGILYNIEFKLGDKYPVAKIYLPVRHYARNDAAVIRGLHSYFQNHQRGSYMANYANAMTTLFTTKSLREGRGVQTYLGCSIRPDGTLRLVSYFKPQLIPDSLVQF